jgi:hypothetical protein
MAGLQMLISSFVDQAKDQDCFWLFMKFPRYEKGSSGTGQGARSGGQNAER